MKSRIELNEDERYSLYVRTRHRKKLLTIIISLIIIMSLLTVRIGCIMTVEAGYYSRKATELHERERAIKAMRGRILDANGTVLADNRTVCTVSVIHNQIKEPQKVIEMLCSELSEEEEMITKKVNKISSIEIIRTNVDKETGDRIREYDYAGVKVDEDYKRYYPYDTLASKVIGFTGRDNQGIVGLEAKYDACLSGDGGKILTLTDAWGSELEGKKEGRLEPKAGCDLYTSIDINIQMYAQQLAEKTLVKKGAKRVSIIVMNPRNGELYAMVNAPEYNLNDPYTLNYDDEDTTGNKMDKLNNMWRNFCINDTYEPGSVFKMVTATAALELGVVSLSDMYTCGGSTDVIKQQDMERRPLPRQ